MSCLRISCRQVYVRPALVRRALCACALLTELVGLGGQAYGQEQNWWRLGGESGVPWRSVAEFRLMVDDEAAAGAIQPWELKPDENLISRLGPWQRVRFPVDPDFRAGHPRIWIDTGAPGTARTDLQTNILPFVDNDTTTYVEQRGEADRVEMAFYYTIDIGNEVPLERFVFFPPEGVSPDTDEPFRPNYIINAFSLTAGQEETGILQEELKSDYAGRSDGFCCPLENVLGARDRNSEEITEVEFPLQNIRFLRFIPLPDGFDRFGDPVLLRMAIAEMQAFGRGFVRRSVWESQVVDIGRDVNFGRIVFGASLWRKDGETLVQVEEAPVSVTVEIRTGRDPTPLAYFGFDDLGAHVEVTKRQWDRLIPLVTRGAVEAVGYRGPVAEDQNNWSFWSTPIRTSGVHPRMPWGQFFQLRIELQSETPWEFARLESLWVETGPLLADRVLGEIVREDQFQPPGGLVVVDAGELTSFVYDVSADFENVDRSGFDALRLLAPAEASFSWLEMGTPPLAAVPDSVVQETDGFSVYLPGRIGPAPGEARRARIGLEAVLYGEAGEFGGEVFLREEQTLLQRVEGGDASVELGSDQLLIVASASSATGVLGDLETGPGALTPQGDGVNDRLDISYTLYRIQQPSDVQVSVFTLGGQRIWKTAAELQNAGRHTISWDGRNEDGRQVPPGIYLVRVEVETDQGTEARVRPIAVLY